MLVSENITHHGIAGFFCNFIDVKSCHHLLKQKQKQMSDESSEKIGTIPHNQAQIALLLTNEN